MKVEGRKRAEQVRGGRLEITRAWEVLEPRVEKWKNPIGAGKLVKKKEEVCHNQRKKGSLAKRKVR